MLPTSTDVTINLSSTSPGKTIAVLVSEGAKDAATSAHLLSQDEQQSVSRLLASGVFRGKPREIHFDILHAATGSKKSNYRRLYLSGLGKPEKITPETLRQAAGAIAKACRKHRQSSIAIVVPRLPTIPPETAAEALATGFLLASFHFDEMKGAASAKKDDEPKPGPVTLTLIADNSASLKPAIARARAIADGQNFARTIASRPGNVVNPPSLAKIVQDMARQVGLTCRILDEKQLAKLGMNGILAVGSASATPPRLIVLEHKVSGFRVRGSAKGNKAKTSLLNPEPRTLNPLLIVGKAITFDTGGVSIKPADKMGKMIYDKCGAMAVLGTMYAAAKLKLDVPIVGILSSAENTLGAKAYRPGDVLRMYNGVTVEVTNTDAEGRLVLGDALAWGVEQYSPRAVVDLATLTGGVIVALGSTMAGIMSNNDRLVADLQRASDFTCEKFWRLPLNDDHRDYIKSHHADIVNSGGREGSPLQGAAFLSHFIPRDDSVPWAHLDIAGVADTDKDLPYYEKGATGWGVRTLVEWAATHVK